MEDGYTTVLKGVSLFFVHESADIVLGWAMPNQHEALVTARRFVSTVPLRTRNQMEICKNQNLQNEKKIDDLYVVN